MPSNMSLGVYLLVIKMPPVLSIRMVPDQEQTTLLATTDFKLDLMKYLQFPEKKVQSYF